MKDVEDLITHLLEERGLFVPKTHASFMEDEDLLENSSDILSDIMYALDMYEDETLFDEEDWLEEEVE